MINCSDSQGALEASPTWPGQTDQLNLAGQDCHGTDEAFQFSLFLCRAPSIFCNHQLTVMTPLHLF